MQMMLSDALLRFYKRNRNLLLYGLIGVSGVLLDSVIYLSLIAAGMHYQLANLLGVNVGILNNFFWNTRFNYCLKDKLFVRFLRFFSVGLFGLGLSALLLFVLRDICGMPVVVAASVTYFSKDTADLIGEAAIKGMVLVVVVMVQFVLNHFYSFKKETGK